MLEGSSLAYQIEVGGIPNILHLMWNTGGIFSTCSLSLCKSNTSSPIQRSKLGKIGNKDLIAARMKVCSLVIAKKLGFFKEI